MVTNVGGQILATKFVFVPDCLGQDIKAKTKHNKANTLTSLVQNQSC